MSEAFSSNQQSNEDHPQAADSLDAPAAETSPELAPAVPAQKIDWGAALRELAETILLTLIIFFLIRLVIENYRIEGSSMEPNFHNDQFLFVNKLVYQLHPPERGDVIVFPPPVQPNKKYIKRIIGLPGEKVQIINGRVFINGVELDEQYQLAHATYNYGPLVLGADEYFVLGDNRPESSDSHAWGPIKGDVIIGKAWASYWPPDMWGLVHDYTYAAPIPKSPPIPPTPEPSTPYP